MVCPQGECSKAISYSSGLQFPKAEIGELIVWSGLDLSYSCVILTRCSKWNGGDGEQVCVKQHITESHLRWKAFFQSLTDTLILNNNNNK